MNHPIPLYDVHPISIKLIKKGHPWILKDKFTEKFHPRDRFIVAKERNKPLALLIHDPKHSNIKARLWSTQGNYQSAIKNFKKDLTQRIDQAIKRRADYNYLEDRDNIYLIFSEADKLPGIKVNLLKDQVLIQFSSFFWENYEDVLVQAIIKSISMYLNIKVTKANVWKQYRADGQLKKKAPICFDPNCAFKEIELFEFDVKYKITLGKNYDPGIYTDMSAIRKELAPLFQNSKRVLNLYAYTGAFSNFAFVSGAQEVCSVDISDAYMQELEENLKINNYDLTQHRSMVMSVKKALNTLISEDKKFNLIICDPPTSSSDGSKRTNALRDYETTLLNFSKLLSPNGKLVIFLNTHKVNKNKFKQKIESIIAENSLPLKIIKNLKQLDDCPGLRGFPEGSYLKGLVLTHDSSQ